MNFNQSQAAHPPPRAATGCASTSTRTASRWRKAARVETGRLGAVTGIDSGRRGTYFFDAFRSTRLNDIDPETP